MLESHRDEHFKEFKGFFLLQKVCAPAAPSLKQQGGS